MKSSSPAFEEEITPLGQMWEERWDSILEIYKGLQKPKNDAQEQLLDILEDKLRVRWMKRLVSSPSMVSMEEGGPLVQILTKRRTSWKDAFFERLKLELKFGVVFLFLFVAMTFLPLWILSSVIEIRYTPLAYFLFITAFAAIYLVSSYSYKSGGDILLSYAVPLVASIYWLVSSNGPIFKTVFLLWIIAFLYHTLMYPLAWIIMHKIKLFDPFECDYCLTLRGLR
jgi:hypothetical protein